jgi:hypothetical protein
VSSPDPRANYDDQTRQYPPVTTTGYPAGVNRDPNAPENYPAEYRRPSGPQDQSSYPPRYRTPVPEQAARDAEQRAQEKTLLAGRYDPQRVAVNLAILAVLSGVIAFAAVMVSDQIIGWANNIPPRSPSEAVLPAILAAVAGVAAGLLYIPVVGTGNENLFVVAVLALTLAGLVFWCLLGGLLDKDWQTISTGVAVLAAGITASLAPARIDAAEAR